MNRKFIFGPCAIAVGLVLGGIGLWILLSPTEYRATTKIEIEPYPMSGGPAIGLDGSYDPYFFETELKVIGSDIVLSNVVETLHLNTQWGKRYGRTLETAKTIPLLEDRMNLEVLLNSRIVEIRVTDEDPKEAARIANAIAKAYSDYRIAQQKQQMANGLKMLEENYAKEETKILIMQSNLDRLHEQLHINDTNHSNDAGPPLAPNVEQQHLKEILIEDEAEYLKLENEFAELKSLQATNPAMLREVLRTMTSDDKLSNLLHELDDNMRKLAIETNGVGGASSDRAAIQASIADLNGQIDARVNGIMMTLKTRVDGAKTAVDTLNMRLKGLEAAGHPYWEARNKLDQEKYTLELLKAKIESDKADLATIPKWIPVKVVDPAVPPETPRGPNRKLGAVLLICGLLTSGFGFHSLRKAGIREEINAKSV